MTDIHNLVALVDESITTIKGKFTRYNRSSKSYTYKCPKALAATLAVGDHVAVEISDTGLSIVEVTAIDDETDIDPNDDTKFVWAFARVDVSALRELKASEAAQVANVKKARRENMRAQARAMLTDPSVKIEPPPLDDGDDE